MGAVLLVASLFALETGAISRQSFDMLFRTGVFLLVVSVIAISLTMYFRFDVLVALGLILMQAKIVAKKLVAVELKSVVAQLKAVGSTFLRIEVLKKWPMTLPHLVGKALLRKLDTFLSRYRDTIFRQYDRSIS